MELDKNMQDFSKAMVVVAHADDAEYGCSGTVAKWCAAGLEVVYVLCTDGSKGTSDRLISPEKLSTIRREEQEAAAKVLGLRDVVFLEYPDSYLEPSLGLRKDIAREIRRYQPEVVITTYPMRSLDGGFGVGHPDHMAAGEATLSAIFPTARDHLTFPEFLDEGLQPHKVLEAWIMGHPQPDHWVDVTKYVQTSIQALTCHASQLQDRDSNQIEEIMLGSRRQRAEGKGMEYAESFRRILFDRRPTETSTITDKK
jgi:LmbE family N-acetylglucosaminyl deacetylase